jgi:hypothetical protein
VEEETYELTFYTDDEAGVIRAYIPGGEEGERIDVATLSLGVVGVDPEAFDEWKRFLALVFARVVSAYVQDNDPTARVTRVIEVRPEELN